MILKLSIIVFITQLIFIGCRAWNVRTIAKNNLAQVLLPGTIVHIAWFVGIVGGYNGTSFISEGSYLSEGKIIIY